MQKVLPVSSFAGKSTCVEGFTIRVRGMEMAL
jgi:hypothetical protein